MAREAWMRPARRRPTACPCCPLTARLHARPGGGPGWRLPRGAVPGAARAGHTALIRGGVGGGRGLRDWVTVTPEPVPKAPMTQLALLTSSSPASLMLAYIRNWKWCVYVRKRTQCLGLSEWGRWPSGSPPRSPVPQTPLPARVPHSPLIPQGPPALRAAFHEAEEERVLEV